MAARARRAIPPRASGAEREATTLDAVLDGALVLAQPALGYRVNLDSLLLARFAAEVAHGTVIDLGAGVGAVGLAVSHLASVERLVLVERDPFFAALAAENLARARVPGEVRTLELGAGAWPPELAGQAQLVVTNPPYQQPGTGSLAAEGRRRAARDGPIAPFLHAARRALGGRRPAACLCFPARSLAALLLAAAPAQLHARRLRLVHARPGADARLALVELRPRSGPLEIRPPLVEWEAPGRPGVELRALGQRAQELPRR